MISIYNLKPAFQKLLTPILARLHTAGIMANQITWSAIVLSLSVGISFWFAGTNKLLFLALPVGLLIRMGLNALDGMMARTYNQQTKKGEVLNELGDVVSDVFIFFPLLAFEQHIIYMIAAFIGLSIINEFAGLLGKVISGERRYEGPLGKSDRAFVMSLYGILMYLGINLTPFSLWIFSILILLLSISTFIRINKALKKA